MAKPWTCDCCGTKNPGRAKFCMECAGEPDDDETPAPDYATKADLQRLEEKIDGLGKAPKKGKKGKKSVDLLDLDEDDDDDADEEEEDEA